MHLKSLVILFFIFSSLSNAQVRLKDTVVEQKLDEVILTATRTYRQLSSLPLPVQIVKQEEILAMNSMRLTDILNEQPGLVTVSEFVGGAGIQMQGLDAQYTLILIDGVPLIGRSAGTLDISRISVGNIKQIEIVKGASSSLYGNKALGGVINIITNKPKKDFHGKLFYRYGTFNTHDTSLNTSFKNDNFSWSLFLNRNSSDGYQFPNAANLNTVDPYSNYTLNSKLGFDLTSKTTIFVSGRYYIQDQIYAPTLEEKGEINISEWNAHLKIEHHFNTKLSGDLELYATRYKADEYLNSIENDSLFSKSDYNELLLRPELKGIYKPSDKSTIIAGVGLTHESLERTDFSTKPIFNSPYIFAQYDGKPKKNLNLILGVRFDSHNEYASQWSPKAAIRFKLNDHLALKGSVGYGFKAPDFRQLYFDYTNGFVGYTILGYNTVVTRIPELEAQGQISNIVVPISEYEDRLNPENSVAYNFGISFDPLSTLQFELNLFKNNIHDLIDTRLIANKTNGQNVYSYYNVKDVYTEGLEFNSSWKPSKTLKFSLGYQLLFAKDKAAEDAFAKGEVYARLSPNSPAFQLDEDDYFGLYNRSRHMVNLKVFYNYEPWKLKSNIRVNYRSKYGLFDTNSNDYLDRYDEFIEGYMIWNWAVNKRINKHYDLGIGIDNIFDFKDPPSSSNDFLFIGNISGRIIYAKFNIQL